MGEHRARRRRSESSAGAVVGNGRHTRISQRDGRLRYGGSGLTLNLNERRPTMKGRRGKCAYRRGLRPALGAGEVKVKVVSHAACRRRVEEEVYVFLALPGGQPPRTYTGGSCGYGGHRLPCRRRRRRLRSPAAAPAIAHGAWPLALRCSRGCRTSEAEDRGERG